MALRAVSHPLTLTPTSKGFEAEVFTRQMPFPLPNQQHQKHRRHKHCTMKEKIIIIIIITIYVPKHHIVTTTTIIIIPFLLLTLLAV